MSIITNTYQFATIADMIANASNLNDGNKVFTLGYDTAGDGGGAVYTVKNDSAAENGGSIISLGTGKIAKLTPVNGTVNVKQFGAKGDGITDDRDSIIKAVSFIDANKIEFDKATYTTARGVSIPRPDIEIIGNGATLQFTGTYDGGSILGKSAAANKNITIRDLTIKGPEYTGDVEVNRSRIPEGIKMSAITGLRLENVTIEKCKFGVHLNENSCNFHMENCNLIKCITGLMFNDTDGVVVKDCYIDTSWSQEFEFKDAKKNHCIYLGGAVSNVLVKNCTLENSGGTAIQHNDSSLNPETLDNNPSQNQTYQDIIIRNCYRAFVIGRSIKKALISNVKVTGVEIGLYIHTCDNIVIKDSEFFCTKECINFGHLFRNILFKNVKFSSLTSIIIGEFNITDDQTGVEFRHCYFESRELTGGGYNIYFKERIKYVIFFDCEFNFAGVTDEGRYLLCFNSPDVAKQPEEPDEKPEEGLEGITGSNTVDLSETPTLPEVVSWIEVIKCRIKNNGTIKPKSAILYSELGANIFSAVKNCTLEGFSWVQRIKGDGNTTSLSGMKNYKNIISYNNVYITSTSFKKAEEYNVL